MDHSTRLRAAGALSLAATLALGAGSAGAQSPSPGDAPVISEACAKDKLALRSVLAGGPVRLTLSTDNPAYGPWFWGDPKTQYPDEPEGGSGWRLGDPYSGEGYEAAVSYAVAAALGFSHAEVDWISNYLFEHAFQPGPKAFDWHVAQVAVLPVRAEAVDFSDSYFDSNQSVIAMTGTPITEVTTMQGLKDFRLGAASFTTALQFIEDVIVPNTEVQVFNSNADALQPLQSGTIDALVMDLQSAFFTRDALLEDYSTPDPEATVVGQFDVPARVDRVGMVLEKDSPLTACVNEALAVIRADGTLDAIYEQWISTDQKVPYFQ